MPDMPGSPNPIIMMSGCSSVAACTASVASWHEPTFRRSVGSRIRSISPRRTIGCASAKEIDVDFPGCSHKVPTHHRGDSRCA